MVIHNSIKKFESKNSWTALLLFDVGDDELIVVPLCYELWLTPTEFSHLCIGREQ